MRSAPVPPTVSLLLAGLSAGCSFGLSSSIEVGVDTFASGEDTAGIDAASGLPPTAVSLVGMTYAIGADTMVIVDPPGLDGFKDQILARDVLVFVAGQDQEALKLNIALAGADGAQDVCEAVRTFPTADYSRNPAFEAGPGELHTTFGGGHAAAFRELELTGIFDEYAFNWRNGTLDAMLDGRELAPALPKGADVCKLVDGMGGACEPCDDGEEACFHLRIEQVVAERVEIEFDVTPTGCDE